MRDNPQFFPGFIFTLTDLNPAEMMIYATIYCFTAKGGKGYTGTLEYLQDTIHENRPSAIRVLNSLMEKGYLIKTKTKGVRSPCYKAVLPKKRAIEPEEVISDDEIRRELESLNESTEIILSNNETNVSKSNTESSIIEHSKVQKSNTESMKIEHIKEKEIKGEINNEIKKETLKKKVSNNPYVQTLFDLGFLDDDDILPCENLFYNYMGSPIERFDRAFWEFAEAFKAGEAQYGVPYLTKFMEKRLNNENDHNPHTR